jgi:cell division protein FtsB
MWIVGAAGLLFMLLVALIILWVQLGAWSSKAKAAAAEIDAYEAQIAENQRTIDYLSSDEHTEYRAREELDLKQKGEEIYTAE